MSSLPFQRNRAVFSVGDVIFARDIPNLLQALLALSGIPGNLAFFGWSEVEKGQIFSFGIIIQEFNGPESKFNE